MSIIKVENLTKTFSRPIREKGFKGVVKDLFNREYEQKIAVDNISFNIKKGEIVGYLGPNGAGKSTSIKMLVGILVPTSGIVEIDGIIPYKNRTENSKKIGVVFGQRSQLWWDIPVSETLMLMKYMYKIPDDLFKRNIEMFTDILGIDQFMSVAVRQLSLGQRMRADLCAALMHNPSIVYLDEPTIGLDVVVKKKIREFLLEINNTYKTTILLTTHDMSDVEKLCSRVIVINDGKKIFDGQLEKLKNEYGSDEVMVARLESSIEKFAELKQLGAGNIHFDPNESLITIHYDKRKVNSSKILIWLMERSKIIDFEVKPCEVDEVIRSIYSNPKLL